MNDNLNNFSRLRKSTLIDLCDFLIKEKRYLKEYINELEKIQSPDLYKIILFIKDKKLIKYNPVSDEISLDINLSEIPNWMASLILKELL